MLLKVFSIYDSATEAYNQPFFMLTKAEAIRAFTNMALDDNSNINKHSADYHLYYLGDYDNATGYVDQSKKLECMGSADLFKNQNNVVDMEAVNS